MAPIKFVVSGQDSDSAIGLDHLDVAVRRTARVSARRAGGETVQLQASEGEDLVLLHLANGPTLVLHPEHARQLLLAQACDAPRDARSDGGADCVQVPTRLRWEGLDAHSAPAGLRRGAAGEVVLAAIEVVASVVRGQVASITAAELASQLDGQVTAGVYQLARGSLDRLRGSGERLEQVPAAGDKPILVLIHGTFVETSSSFGGLWRSHPGKVNEIFAHYGDRVYALDHPTLGASPFQNALTLIEALPPGAQVHLLTHSRGGLVGEVLARVCEGNGLGAADHALFEGDRYESHRKELVQLREALQSKQGQGARIEVKRLVRVACPVRGTLLASRRLDAYLSVLSWTLGLAGAPVLPELVKFLAAVARHRTDPEELPGLEAMMPGRPMSRWLNAASDPLTVGDLRVIAGDVEGDSLRSWLKTLLSDAFFWTDNDLIVQTRSMYGGAARDAASFVLDRGAKISHFTYFSNERSAEAIKQALIEKEMPSQFRVIGPLSWAGQDSSGIREAMQGSRSARDPAVIVLPGLLGSELQLDDRTIWLSLRFFNNLESLRWRSEADRVKVGAPIERTYGALMRHLAQTHQVIPFGFDWRRPIEESARLLAGEVEAALAAREQTGQPVRILAHSMGGLVARTMQLEKPEVWDRMLAHADARVVLLGTPNGGSFSPMQVLSGDDLSGNVLSLVGSLFDGPHEARQTIAGMPGILQLQAGLDDPRLALHTAEGWKALEDRDLEPIRRRIRRGVFWHADKDEIQLKALRWGLPSQAVLDCACALRRRLDAQKLAAHAEKICVVVGKAPFTPAGVEGAENGIVYVDHGEPGDGRVCYSRARLQGARIWQADVSHGELSHAARLFSSYTDLLSSGNTVRLPDASRPLRGVETRSQSERARLQRSIEPPAEVRDLFSPPDHRDGDAALRVTVVHGNLAFVRDPLLVGHYESLKLTGTEWVIDRSIGESMSRSLSAGTYPSAIGTAKVFMNPSGSPERPYSAGLPSAAIVVGLGAEGLLRMADLEQSVYQGILEYAGMIPRKPAKDGKKEPAGTFEVAATLLGSGGTSFMAGTSAQATALGVRRANARLAELGWPTVVHLRLVEVYLDRATEALQALVALSDVQASDLMIDRQVQRGTAGLAQGIDVGYRGTSYDFVAIEQRTRDSESEPEISFTLATRRARDEVRGVVPQRKLVDVLVAKGTAGAGGRLTGRSLFTLMVPREIEPFLVSSSSLMMQLDSQTAAIPWEMLDASMPGLSDRDRALPWAIRTGLLRKLRTEIFRAQPIEARVHGRVLVIGEPQSRYAALPAAVAEAEEVGRIFDVDPLLHGDAAAIIHQVLDGAYAVLHVAGHGGFVGRLGGVLLSDDAILGPSEVEAMRIVPELVFLNCCHLARFQDGDTAFHPARFAASVSEQFIRVGVRCVVAAGWAVEDEPARCFASRFYKELRAGARFVKAVVEARTETYQRYPDSNTWAAYQCYGDPDWTLPSSVNGSSPKGGRAHARGYEHASADALLLNLIALKANHAYGDREYAEILEEVEGLETSYGASWGGIGAVAASFGDAFNELGKRDRAIEWYRRALRAEDGGSTIRALEQLGNLTARRGGQHRDRAEVEEGIRILKGVMKLGATSERHSLLGSAYKRAAWVTQGRSRARHLRQSLDCYQEARRIAEQSKSTSLYPRMNCIGVGLLLDLANRRRFAVKEIQNLREEVAKQHQRSPDFWSDAAGTELKIWEAVVQGQLAALHEGISTDEGRSKRKCELILEEFGHLRTRVRSRQWWDSVACQNRILLELYRAPGRLSQDEEQAVASLLTYLEKEDPLEAAAPLSS